MSGSQENKIIAVFVPPSEIKITMTTLLTHRTLDNSGIYRAQTNPYSAHLYLYKL